MHSELYETKNGDVNIESIESEANTSSALETMYKKLSTLFSLSVTPWNATNMLLLILRTHFFNMLH